MAKTDDSYKPDSAKRFGLALKRLLERKRLSQREFAKRAELAPDYVSKLVNGSINEPRKSTVEKIANGLGISVEELWRQVEQCTETTEPVPLDCPAETDLSERDSLVEAPPIAEADPQVPQKFVVGLDVLRTVPVWLGRDQLLQQLQAEFVGTAEQGNLSRPVVLVLVGQGGIGKTSLAVKLLEAVGVDLRRAELAHQSVYAGVICWRAEEGSSFDEVSGFLLAALGMASAEPVKEAGQKIQQIIQGLQRQRYLLLLDNLEVILQPASQPEAGRAIEPEWGQLLNALVYRPHQSQMILTSREVPVDLGDLRYPDLEPDSALVRIERLGGVDVAAGAEILSQRQVQDSEADRCWVAERVEGHVFVLTQLAAVAKGKPGYLRQHPQLVTQKADPILREQLARQSEPARELLKRMCVLRVGIDVRGLTFLRLYQEGEESEDDWLWSDESESDSFRFRMAVAMEESVELTEAEIQETQDLVDRLVDSCLVQCRYDEHKREDVYDLHRLIVEFLQAEYQTELPNLLKRVYSFYRTGKTIDNPKTLEDLRPVLEAQHFAFQLGNYDEAANLLMWTLENYLRPWGHWNFLKDLYEQILPHVDEDERPVCLRQIGRIYRDFGVWDKAETYFQEALSLSQDRRSKSDIATSLACLGGIERNRGNWDGAEKLYRQSLQIEEELGDRSGMATSWGQLGYIERKRGNWDGAEKLYRQSLQLREELGDRSGMASSWGVLGDIERNRGNWDGAEKLYRQSLQLREELGDRSGMASSWGVLGDIERNRGNWDEAEQLFRQSLQLREELGDRSGVAEVISCLGENELGRGNLDKAESFLKEALERMQALGMIWYIAATNSDLAQLERQRGNAEKAQEHYTIAHQLFTQLGAAKDLEKLEREWH